MEKVLRLLTWISALVEILEDVFVFWWGFEYHFGRNEWEKGEQKPYTSLRLRTTLCQARNLGCGILYATLHHAPSCPRVGI